MASESSVWVSTLIALVIISSVSLIGAAVLVVRQNTLQRVLLVLISFAAGALLGDAFLHIIPEISESEHGFDVAASLSLLGGVVAFFVLEKILHWHHSHLPADEVIHPVAVSNLIGDGLHNFLDGAIVAGAFLASTKVGIATTVAVALHEIPQELGDFGILVHSGLKPRRALALNLLTALAAIAGGVAVLAISSVGQIERVFLPLSAGAFVYIASTDLIPELHKEPEPAKSIVQVLALLTGVGVMGAMLALE